MTTVDFITELFCRVDDAMRDVKRHSQAQLHPSEIVTLGLLHALKGSGPRPFMRWLTRDYKPLFPTLPERTRLFRLFKTHLDWVRRFLAQPSPLGVCDSYGIELLHPMRQGRSPQQIGKKGKSNHRWIVGIKVCSILNQWGLVVDWGCATANVSDQVFQPLIGQFHDSQHDQEQMVVFSDTGFHAKAGDPPNLKVCPRGTWNERMIVEQVWSMLSQVCHFKQQSQRAWAYVRARLAFTVALFNLLVQWDGLQIEDDGMVRLSIARFSL